MSKIKDFFQELLMSNPKRAQWFMSSMESNFWMKQGEKNVLTTFHEAAEKVPAYKDFLKKHEIKDHTKIKTVSDFQKYVPLIDKKNYLNSYPLKDLVKGRLEESYTLYISGGTTGPSISILAPREDFKVYPLGMAAIFDYFWDICSKRVLFINAMSLGIWIGGTIGSFLYKSLCDKYKSFTVITPGADPERVVDVLEKIGSYYDLIFISSYPTLLKMIFEEGDKRNLPWDKLNVRIGTGGDTLDDSLIDYFINKISPKKRISRFVFEGYGLTEFGNPASSTPLSIKIKDMARINKAFSQDIFGDDNSSKLFQFNPMGFWIESVNGDLVITKNSKMPLVRYSPRDIGKVISWIKMREILKKHQVDIQVELKKENFTKPFFKWPFMVFSGRRDWAISFFGAKISPYQLLPIFSKDSKIHGFKIATKEKNDLAFRFVVFLETKPSIKISDEEKIKLEEYYQKRILDLLLKTNLDFEDAYKINKEILTPKVIICPFRKGPFEKEKGRIKPNLIT